MGCGICEQTLLQERITFVTPKPTVVTFMRFDKSVLGFLKMLRIVRIVRFTAENFSARHTNP